MSNLNNKEIKVYNMPPKIRKSFTLLNVFTENSFQSPRVAHPSPTLVIKGQDAKKWKDSGTRVKEENKLVIPCIMPTFC